MTTAATATAKATTPGPSLLASYRPVPGVFDELLGENGEMRAHYVRLMDHLSQLGMAELKTRDETGNRLIQEQGVTYTVYGDPQGHERPWQLDPIPFVIPAAEWGELEVGLIQRAT